MESLMPHLLDTECPFCPEPVVYRYENPAATAQGQIDGALIAHIDTRHSGADLLVSGRRLRAGADASPLAIGRETVSTGIMIGGTGSGKSQMLVHARENAELQYRFAHQEETRRGAVNELIAEMDGRTQVDLDDDGADLRHLDD